MNKKKLIVSLVLSVVLASVYFIIKKPDCFESVSSFFGLISDSFLIPAVLLGGIGAISWIASKGLFDILSYGTKNFLGHFIKPIEKKLPCSFYDYKMNKEKKGRTWFQEIAVVGLFSLIISIISLIIYLTI